MLRRGIRCTGLAASVFGLVLVGCAGGREDSIDVGPASIVEEARAFDGLLKVRLRPNTAFEPLLAPELFAGLLPESTMEDAKHRCDVLIAQGTQLSEFLGCEFREFDFGPGWLFRFRGRDVRLCLERSSSGASVREHMVLRVFTGAPGLPLESVVKLHWPPADRRHEIEKVSVYDDGGVFAFMSLKSGLVVEAGWQRR